MTNNLVQIIKTCTAVGLCGMILLAGWQAQAQTSTSAMTSTTMTAAKNSSSQLVGRLSKELSITPTQAKGGAGSLFALAKTRLTEDEFSKVSSAVPGMSGLLKAAPQVEPPSGLAGLESELPGNMGRMAEVAEAFHKLGLSPEMAVKFVPVMSKFVESKGGSATASLLEKALK